MSLNREYPELKACREAIDAIDDELIALLKKRSKKVQEVGELKRAAGEITNFIRPDREAKMIRRIAQAFAGEPFSARAATAIWRIIIGASTSMEAPLNLAITGQGATLAAREHFGPSLPCQVMDAGGIIRAMKADAHTIGILTASELGHWEEFQREGLRVFARLPYASDAAADRCLPSEPCFAAARIEPAPSGEDCSLLLLLAAEAVSAASARVLTREGDRQLIEVDGWHEDSAAFAELAARLGVASDALLFLGGYGTPFEIAR